MQPRPTRFYSKRQETRIAKEFGGKTTANSGATLFDKGDVKDKHFLLECKTSTTVVASKSIKKEWLDKNREEMFATGKQFNATIFDFGDGKDYIILDIDTFQEMYKAWKELYGDD